MSKWLNNPVLTKEIKLRFRSFKSYLGIAIYLIVLGLLVLGYMGAYMSFDTNHAFQPSESRGIFLVLCLFQLALFIFVTPGLTAGVISSERERQTLPILLTTAQSSSVIIISKMIASLAYLLLYLIASLPLYTMVFLYGGVSPALLLSSIGLFILTMITIAAIGIWTSTFFQKTIVSMVTSYGIAFFLTGGFAIVTLMMSIFGEEYTIDGASFPWPLILASINIPIMLYGLFDQSPIIVLQEYAGWKLSPWWFFVSFYVLLISLLLFTSIRRLRPRMKKQDQNRTTNSLSNLE
ncbi:ABC transporter permease [Alkalicoccobacillus gibsonii]|uniref:ABC transporter permease n=1 Tax=Alkalicoccobacillus gibsonii TaxID=79881 RepID=UPI0035148E3F